MTKTKLRSQQFSPLEFISKTAVQIPKLSSSFWRTIEPSSNLLLTAASASQLLHGRTHVISNAAILYRLTHVLHSQNYKWNRDRQTDKQTRTKPCCKVYLPGLGQSAWTWCPVACVPGAGPMGTRACWHLGQSSLCCYHQRTRLHQMILHTWMTSTMMMVSQTSDSESHYPCGQRPRNTTYALN